MGWFNCRSSMVLRFTLALVLLIGTLSPPVASAADFPTKPIRYILHVTPGGATDVIARQLAQVLPPILGQPVVVENRPGGGGAAQMAILTSAPPDGHTIGGVTASHIGAFHTTLTQYSVDSVEWVAGLVVDPFLLAVPADSPFQTTNDLIRYLSENPGQLNLGGFGGEGSASHIAWSLLAEVAGVEGNWIPYDSVGDSVLAVLGGHIDAAIAYPGLVKDYVQTGRLRVLGILAPERVSLLPDVPTFAEQGYDADVSWMQFRGVIAPKGVPNEVLTILSDAILQAMETEQFQAYLQNNDLIPASLGHEEFTRFVRQQDAITARWIEKLGALSP